MKGLFGKFLDMNLSTATIDDYAIPQEWMEKYFGGRGIGARILLEELEVGVDPLRPENILIFATGPLQGTGVAGAGRHVVMAKSPKTGSVSDSYAGGFFAHELGTSGYDGIIIRGRADSPKYISLIGGEGEIHDAEDLWGMEVAETEAELKGRHGGGRVSSIGIAGENLVRFACIMNDRNRAAGRPGFGAVMGSKKLKAVIVKGGIDKPLHDEERLREARSEFAKNLDKSSKLEFGKYGTSGGIGGLNEMGILPTKNFQEGVFDGAEKISGERMHDEILTGRDNCTGCPIRCKRVVSTEFDGEQVEERYGGPEYETIAALGSLCMNDNLDSIALANQKCNKYGLDTISTGNTIAFAIECTEKGIIDSDLRWGGSKSIVRMVDKIARREGLGDTLAKGIDQIAGDIGADFAVISKSQEIPMHDPRGKKGLGISYATSPRGGTHMEGFHDDWVGTAPELGVTDLSDRFSFQGKPEAVKIFEDLQSFVNSVILCAFTVNASGGNYNPPLIREMINAATGLEIDADEMEKIGERNYNLLKILSGREGYSRKDDGLPKRLREPLPRGASADEPIPEEEMQRRIDEYYKIRGWEGRGSTKEKLEELGMSELKKFVNW